MEKQIKEGVLFGMGYVCGKHNLEIKKNERERIANDFVKKEYTNKTSNAINPKKEPSRKELLYAFKEYWKKSSHQTIEGAIKGFLKSKK